MVALTPERFAATSRLFSSAVVREMARRGKSPLFARLARESGLIRSSTDLVRSLYETAFALLKREGHRQEYVYKSAITQKVLLGQYSLRTASMLNEFRVGECKADLVILNGTARVYEIKSERDSLARLERQIAAYRTVFAEVFVIAASSHVDSVLACVPHDVGVLRLNSRHQISPVRNAIERSNQVSPLAIFESIRTEEARMALQDCGVSTPAVPNTELNRVLRELFITLEPARAHAGFVSALKRTRSLMPLSALVSELPSSLHSAALSIPLRKIDHARLISAVNTPLREAVAWG